MSTVLSKQINTGKYVIPEGSVITALKESTFFGNHLDKVVPIMMKKVGKPMLFDYNPTQLSGGEYCHYASIEEKYKIAFIFSKGGHLYAISLFADSEDELADIDIDLNGHGIASVIKEVSEMIWEYFYEGRIKQESLNNSSTKVNLDEAVIDIITDYVQSDYDAIIHMLQNDRIMKVYRDSFLPWVSATNSRRVSDSAFNDGAKAYLAGLGLRNVFSRVTSVIPATPRPAEIPVAVNNSFAEIYENCWKENFEDVDMFTREVALGKENGLFIYGDAGSGKSFTCYNALDEELGRGNYELFKGGVNSPAALCALLFKMRDGRVIVFDDNDDALASDGVNYLKSALDPEPVRVISKIGVRNILSGEGNVLGLGEEPESANAIPARFEFSSRVIFISNTEQVDPAIASRVLCVGIHMTNDEMLEKIKDTMVAAGEHYAGKYTEDQKETVLSFLVDNVQKIGRIDLRKFSNCLINIQLYPSNWENRTLRFLAKL